jgi:type IV pilus assembly protein PilA
VTGEGPFKSLPFFRIGKKKESSAMSTRPTAADRMLQRDRAQRGFTLIELLVVVAIILIIAAIAIPNLLRSRIAADEASAVSHVRAILTASTAYSTTWDNGYPPSLGAMGGTGIMASCDQSLLLDNLITTPPYQKAGYTFAYTPFGTPAPQGPGCSAPGTYSFLVSATPTTLNFTGQRSFCSDLPGVIHFDPSGSTITTIAACDAFPTL